MSRLDDFRLKCQKMNKTALKKIADSSGTYAPEKVRIAQAELDKRPVRAKK